MASAGPPQIMRVHFQPSELASSRWLRQEIRNVGLFFPFFMTTGGCGSKLARGEFGPGATAEVAEATPAAAQAAGFAMPALSRAVATFCCCVMSADLVAPEAEKRRI